jgi:hypothetical protein
MQSARRATVPVYMLMAAGCAIGVLACGPVWAQGAFSPKGKIATIKVEQAGRGEVSRMEGSLTFEQNDAEVKAILSVINDCEKAIWVPRSPEAITISVGGEPSTHVDFASCAFPEDYVLLKPQEIYRYVQRLPKGAKGHIEMQVWAPWRTPDGKSLVSAQALKAALKADESLVENVVGVGQWE